MMPNPPSSTSSTIVSGACPTPKNLSASAQAGAPFGGGAAASALPRTVIAIAGNAAKTLARFGPPTVSNSKLIAWVAEVAGEVDRAPGNDLRRTRDLLQILANFSAFFNHESCGICTSKASGERRRNRR